MGDLQQFEVFMQQHQDMVYAVAVRLLSSTAEAEDVAQETFLRAYEHFAAVQHYERPDAWLRTVTTRLCLNYLERYRARWKFFSEFGEADESGHKEMEIPIEETQTQGADDAVRSELLDQALRQLPDAQRVPLVLYHLENVPYEDIARQTGLPLGTVKTNIHRGRQALARYLRKQQETGELLN